MNTDGSTQTSDLLHIGMQYLTCLNIYIVSFQEPSLYIVKAILILDNDGNRLISKVKYLIAM